MSGTMRAYVSVQAVKNVAGLVDYLEHGRGAMRQAHVADGTNRFAAMYCDASSPQAFVEECRRIASEKSRKNEAYSLIVSPPEGTYDKNDSRSMDAMVGDVVEGGRRAYPNKKLLAVAHTDSEGSHGCGGKPHVHLVVQNHDLETGKAVVDNRTAPKVRAIFNQLGAEVEWAETEVTHERTVSTSFSEPVAVDTSRDDAKRAAERKKLASVGEFELKLYDDIVRAKDAATGKDYGEWQKSFRAELAKDGITMEFVKGKSGPHQKKVESGKSAQGVVYRRRNPATGRVNGRPASKLGDEVKVGALRQASKDYVLGMRRAEAARKAAGRVAEAKRLDDEKKAREAENARVAKEAQDTTDAHAKVDDGNLRRQKKMLAEVRANEAKAAQERREQFRRDAPSLHGLVIDGVSWDDVKEWEKGKRDEYKKWGEKLETVEEDRKPALHGARRRLASEVTAMNDVFTTEKNVTSEERGRQAVMQYVAEQKAIEARERLKLSRYLETIREEPVDESRDLGRETPG